MKQIADIFLEILSKSPSRLYDEERFAKNMNSLKKLNQEAQKLLSCSKEKNLLEQSEEFVDWSAQEENCLIHIARGIGEFLEREKIDQGLAIEFKKVADTEEKELSLQRYYHQLACEEDPKELIKGTITKNVIPIARKVIGLYRELEKKTRWFVFFSQQS